MRIFLATLLALVLAVPAHADKEAFDLDAAAAAFATADTGQARLASAMRILAAKPSAADVAKALPGAWTWDEDVDTGKPVTWTRRGPDGTMRTVHAFAPASYTPTKAWPLLVYLHGGVSAPRDGSGQSGVAMFAEDADERGFLILSPSTQPEATWWDPAGVVYLRQAIEDMARRYRVDPNRVAVSGFSDGGSGCFHLLAHDPTPFACFLPMMGNPLVTRIFGGPTWGSNLASRPVYAVNGGKDRLYPSERMKPFIEAMQAAGAQLTWVDEPDAGHEPSFLEGRWPEMVGFWNEHVRDARPRAFTWASSAPQHDGRFAWVEILALSDKADAWEALAAPVALGLPDMTPRPRLGIRLDTTFEGPGLKIEEVEEGTPAADAGFEDGDVILKAGDEEIAGSSEFAKLRDYLAGLEDEDGTFTVKRGDDEVVLTARPKSLEKDRQAQPEGRGYGVVPGIVSARVMDGNVLALETRGVAKVRVYLVEGLVDFDRELAIAVNGRKRFKGLPPQDPAVVLAEAARTIPGSPIVRGYVDIDLMEKTKK